MAGPKIRFRTPFEPEAKTSSIAHSALCGGLADTRPSIRIAVHVPIPVRLELIIANQTVKSMNEKNYEALKHKNSKDLELLKWQFKKEELSYVEAGQHLRSLNQQLWQVPSMVIAITGGIWFGAASITSDMPKVLALSFAAAVNILTIPIIIRLRHLIQKYIKLQLAFMNKEDGKGGRTVITCWILLLSIAACLSIAGASHTDKINIETKKTEPSATEVHLHLQKIEVFIQ
ncbi:hypothetical protein K7459_06550 [Pseudomonas fluorescens]|uniref:Uncharacterized protein n=1 Tax=Pseudomonas fluorescens (strain Pf0-1) TaxID=205922 RepID=Q3KIC6_PSEPF|nr:hypothetical protein [Pseudomonas fluorescens]ABA72480.1 hypothetical protein Pfl01_0737 [Pseudomonas fluorescens Pf0-1]MBY9023316.1 hypothetical protein [Pseudomonas fluorescens]MBY9029308.1 hypothetical protein [Pseudomonas fluorescens]MBY9034474.1 hypothetical protein [Pseudomonas fluorescens]MBY9040960.1 hypothetical protein [Pseudomonas fluorescens]